MCHQLGITRSAFYKWKHRIVPEQEQLNSEIAELIKEYDERFSHILGYRRMTVGSIISIIRITQEREFTEL